MYIGRVGIQLKQLGFTRWHEEQPGLGVNDQLLKTELTRTENWGGLYIYLYMRVSRGKAAIYVPELPDGFDQLLTI